MMRQNTIVRDAVIAGVLTTLFISVFLVSWYMKPKRRPELQVFIDKYQSIQVEMTEQEVDELLAGYVMSRWREGALSHLPEDVVRPSAFTKTYDLQLSPLPHPTASTVVEGDYGIDVFFDKCGQVVGKRIAAYLTASNKMTSHRNR